MPRRPSRASTATSCSPAREHRWATAESTVGTAMSLQRRLAYNGGAMMNPAARMTPLPSITFPSPEPARRPATVSRLHLVEPAESLAGDDLAARAPAPISAVIADGQRLIRAGLRRLFEDQLDIAVTREAARDRKSTRLN